MTHENPFSRTKFREKCKSWPHISLGVKNWLILARFWVKNFSSVNWASIILIIFEICMSNRFLFSKVWSFCFEVYKKSSWYFSTVSKRNIDFKTLFHWRPIHWDSIFRDSLSNCCATWDFRKIVWTGKINHQTRESMTQAFSKLLILVDNYSEFYLGAYLGIYHPIFVNLY